MDYNYRIEWMCPGSDMHMMPEAVFDQPFSSLEDQNALKAMIEEIAEFNGEEAWILPVIQNQEACVYGASMSKKRISSFVEKGKEYREGKGYWSPGDYPYPSLEALWQEMKDWEKGRLLKDSRTRTLLQLAAGLNQRAAYYVELQMPLSVLGALVNPTSIYRAMRKKKESFLEEILAWLGEDMILYVKELVDCGCSLISLADPIGRSSLIGPRLYESFAGPWEVRFLQACQDVLAGGEAERYSYVQAGMESETQSCGQAGKKARIHLCGQMSADLVNGGFMEKAETIPTPFTGLSCIRMCMESEKGVFLRIK